MLLPWGASLAAGGQRVKNMSVGGRVARENSRVGTAQAAAWPGDRDRTVPSASSAGTAQATEDGASGGVVFLPEYPALRVKNTFLEFCDELWTPTEDTPRPRSGSSPPCAGAPDGGAARSLAEGSGDALSDEEVPSEGRWEALEAAEGNDQGDLEAPSVGSLLHLQAVDARSRRCKPCAFVHSKGCASGASCRFCHLCGPDEKRRRQKERWEQKRRQWRQFRKAERHERLLYSQAILSGDCHLSPEP